MRGRIPLATRHRVPTLAIQFWALFLVLPWLLRTFVVRMKVSRVTRLVGACLCLSIALASVALAVGMRPFLAAFAPTYPLATAVLVLVPIALSARTSRLSPVSRLLNATAGVVASVTGGLLVWMTVFNIQYGFGSDCRPTLAEPRNRVLFGPCRQGWETQVRAIVGGRADLLDARQSRAVWAASDPRFVYTACGLEGTVERDHPLARIDRRTGAVDRSYVTSAVFDGSCDPASGRCIVLLSAERRYLVIDDHTGEVVHDGALPVGPRFVSVHGRRAIVGLSAPPVLADVDLMTGEARLPSTQLDLYLGIASRGGGVAAVGGDPSAEDTFFAIEYPASRLEEILRFPSGPLATAALAYSPLGRGPLGRFGFASGDVQLATLTGRDAFWSFQLILGIAPDRARRKVYYVAPTAGEVLAHDYDRMSFDWRLKLKAGVRVCDLDRARGRLFVGDYAGGWLFVVDVDQRAVVDRVFVGRGVRQVRFDDTRNRVLVASRSGFVEVDVYGRSGGAKPGS